MNKKKQQYLPPRGDNCINWVPYAKAKLMERDEMSNKQRLLTAQIVINLVLSLVFEILKLNGNCLNFRLKCDGIIYEIIEEWNNTLLLKWNGIQSRNNKNKLETIRWEGKHGYFHKCTNYIDQYKNTVSHKLWLPVFQQLLDFINTIEINQYGDNKQLVELFKSCLTFSCIYGLFVSTIKFFQCSPKPIIINTAMVKNGKITRWLKEEIDAEMTIFCWREEEIEKPQITKSNKNKDQICQRVRSQCVEYMENKIKSKFEELGYFGNIPFDQFKVNIAFDKKGSMIEKEEKYQFDGSFDCSPKVSTTYFNKDYYFQQKNRNNKESKEQKPEEKEREFQRVSDFSISTMIQNRNNMNVDKRTVRRDCIEANIQLIRHNMHLNNSNQSNQSNQSPNMDLLLRENYELKRKHWFLSQQLQSMCNNNNNNNYVPDVSYNISSSNSCNICNSCNSCNSCINNGNYDKR